MKRPLITTVKSAMPLLGATEFALSGSSLLYLGALLSTLRKDIVDKG